MIRLFLIGCTVLMTVSVTAQPNLCDDQMAFRAPSPSSGGDLQEKSSQVNQPSTTVLGPNTLATGNYSTAIGHGAKATDDNTMILGGSTEKDRVTVGIGTHAPNSLASLDLGDTDKGLLLNRLSAEQISMFEMALGMADEGMTVYNTSTHSIQVWDGLNWENLGVQEIKLEDHQLELEDAGVVDLSTYQQDLTTASLSGTELTVAIENGKSVAVDLAPLFEQYDERLHALEDEVRRLSIENEANSEDLNAQGVLFQNVPNPFDKSSTINYSIPESAKSANIVLSNNMGQIVSNNVLDGNVSRGALVIDAKELTAGIYYFTLYVDEQSVDTKKLIVDR